MRHCEGVGCAVAMDDRIIRLPIGTPSRIRGSAAPWGGAPLEMVPLLEQAQVPTASTRDSEKTAILLVVNKEQR
jgi:hypothetical protein